ncbi:MAG: primase-helicase zinc-binding domain-containing protein [Deltaproteobacteria bacterium]
MNTLSIAISCGLTPKKVAGTKGGEYASACPMCGGRDRFRLWPHEGEHGAWWCRGCGKGGDAIQLLRETKSMSYKEACQELGHEINKAVKRNRTPVAPKIKAPDFTPRDMLIPADLWQAKAKAFVKYAHEQLLYNPNQLEELAHRGIVIETIKRFKLGWNPNPLWREKTVWGVTDNGKKLWLPEGLVIPYMVAGRVLRLRIRRPEPDAEQRYYIIPGSGMSPMVIPPSATSKKEVWVIVESELDAILIALDAGDIVGSAALGSVGIKPDSGLYAALKSSAALLVALDADEAGAKAWQWWHEHFPQADRWPVPAGKDPGDYRKAGGDIRAWILAGLPYDLRPAPPTPEPSAIPAPADPGAEATETLAEEGETYVRGYQPCRRCGKRLDVLYPRKSTKQFTCWDCVCKNTRSV